MSEHPSLVGRLIAWQLLAMAMAWLVLTTWLMLQMMSFGDGDFDRRLTVFAQVLAEAGSATGNAPSELSSRVARAERIYIDGVLAEAGAPAGYTPVYELWSAHGAPVLSATAAGSLDLRPGRTATEDRQLAHEAWRVVTATSSDGRVIAVVAERDAGRWQASAPMIAIIGGSQVLIFVWIVGVTWVAARRGFRPLTSLASEIARRQPGDLKPLRPSRLYAETAPVVQEINGLLAREEHRLNTERGFLADAAHELRTPLAAVGAQAHVLLNAQESAERGDAFRELQAGIARVSHLLTQLLTIARWESGFVPVSTGPVDLAELCRHRLAVLSTYARGRAISLSFDGPQALVTTLSAAAFQSVVDNLVDNAVRYTPQGGHVEVRLEQSAGEVTLIVRDDGPGIPEHERERVFERFVRLSAGSESGSGLGLAIVRRILASQAGAVYFVEGLSTSGLGLRVSLPTPAAAA